MFPLTPSLSVKRTTLFPRIEFPLAWFGNTPERTSELISSIQEALDSGRLTRRDGERLRGRLQFAAGQLFGRHLRVALGELNRHVTSGASVIGDTLAACLLAIVDFLADGEPRRVDGNFLDFVHVYVDASFSPDGYSGAGGLVLSSSGTLLDFFSEEIDAEFIASFKRSSQQTVIYELESLAVIVALCLFPITALPEVKLHSQYLADGLI